MVAALNSDVFTTAGAFVAPPPKTPSPEPLAVDAPPPVKPVVPTDRPAATGRNLVDNATLLAAQQASTPTDNAQPAKAADTPEAGNELTEAEEKQVRELKKRDAEVRRHEEAHARVGGQYAGQPSYDYQTGPDGKRYAVGGQVAIDVSPVEGDPAATIAKMDVVKRAALAPAEPSAQDRSVAAEADRRKLEAQSEQMAQKSEDAATPGGRAVASYTALAGATSADAPGGAFDLAA